MTFPLKEIDEMSVHLWSVPLDRFLTDLPDQLQCLSPEEKERAARFRFERDRKRYEISHGALRVILGLYLGRESHCVRLEICETGKPELLAAPGDPLIRFNMSHSGDMMILGVTRNRRIGVDVEMINPGIDIFQIAQRYFNAEEEAEIREAPAENQPEIFFSHWTTKEAHLKAVGCGLAGGLKSCSLTGRGKNRILSAGKIVQSCSFGQWTIYSLKPSDGYLAAVVVEGEHLEFIQVDAAWSFNTLLETAHMWPAKISAPWSRRHGKAYAATAGE